MSTIMKELKKIGTARKVICITGGIGQGKTLTLSSIAKEIKDITQGVLYSNYALKNSIDINMFMLNNDFTIIAIDELEHVTRGNYSKLGAMMNMSENENIIYIIESFDFKKIPIDIKNVIDIHLSVKKDSGTINVKGENVEFELDLDIEESSKNYNAFESVKVDFW